MCGRYYIDDNTAQEIEKLVRKIDKQTKTSGFSLAPRDIHPSDTAPILSKNGSILCCKAQRWGFPGFGTASRQLIFNARCESVLEKPLFNDSIFYRRIVVPAAWFYEWNQNKEKNIFLSNTHTTLFMAGCYNHYADGDRFVIFTTKANTSMQPVHDRMPLILEPTDIMDWIFNFHIAERLLLKEPRQLSRKSEYEQISLF